jgi:NhaP-type Na+/H+ or K+/H+ antiporter
MTEAAVAVIALLVLVWAVVSGALARHDVTGPLVFTIAGFLLANPEWGPLGVDIETGAVHALAEITLALVLFSDASRVNLSELRHEASMPLRLLGIGLPMTLILGGLIASVMFGEFTWALAGYVGAALAPTDAALSVQVINDKRVPMRLRRGLNVESGLNDGIVTPVVTLMLALAAGQLGIEAESEAFIAGAAVRELGLGLLVGLALGWAGAMAINIGSRRGWALSGGRRLATLATAVAAFTVAVAFDGNGFISAFVAGIGFGAALDQALLEIDQAVQLPELVGELLALVVWFLFGATLVPMAFEHLSGPMIGYALLSLTLIRMLPVALAMTGSGVDRKSVWFMAWFGPRGLASVVFALLAIEDLGELVEEAVAVVALTVLLSVVLHGVTAGPAGRRFVHGDEAEAPGPRARSSRLVQSHPPE